MRGRTTYGTARMQELSTGKADLVGFECYLVLVELDDLPGVSIQHRSNLCDFDCVGRFVKFLGTVLHEK